jgi:hypothetical protein
MYEELTVKTKKAHADLQVAQREILAALAALREQYRQIWTEWKEAGDVARVGLADATIRESAAITAAMRQLNDIVFNSRPDSDIWEEMLGLMRTDLVWDEVMNDGR